MPSVAHAAIPESTAQNSGFRKVVRHSYLTPVVFARAASPYMTMTMLQSIEPIAAPWIFTEGMLTSTKFDTSLTAAPAAIAFIGTSVLSTT